ncbi:probable LRR receptor-like serine/threonine-protein kinase At3g47570 [Lycium barbarum]|uniref:probable LRR receptor-like serine/threonine-protein kinase At3g47570 n=1 Tax=Lycium barbarum TaxID=112863 RepID=UPI00293E4A10|nr:probable LRR receptor-like serine/threonine-protein kinase At3g47570 [Lycium barbarum]
MVKLQSLLNLNLSFSNLEGTVPIDGVFKNASAVEIKGKNLCGGISQLHLYPCPVKNTRKPRKQNASLKVILAIVAAFSFLILLFSTFTFMYLKKKKKNSRTEFPATSSMEDIPLHPKITYKELHNATRGFSSENLIGTGNFGRVYRGALPPSEVDMAVKVLNLNQRGASKSFLAECQALRNIRHRNLIKVLSVCSSSDFQGNDFKALIYQFMPNGSLDKRLHPQGGHFTYASLDIVQRISIAVDVASALHYLHYQCTTTVIHCDLKPSNILLDDDLTAHVSDFRLARLLVKINRETNVNQFSSLVVKGTMGYIAPVYGMGAAASTWGDVYSYGILLLELFTGNSPVDETFQDGLNLHNFVKHSLPDRVLELIDQSALEEAAYQGNFKADPWIECLISLLQIGVTCSAEYPQDRMNTKQVLDRLHSVRGRFLGPQIHPEEQLYTASIDE